MGDSIEGQLGDDASNAVVGKANRQRVEDRSAHSNQVHVAVERLSQVSERETETINELARQIGALTRALTGDPLRIDGIGLIQQVREMEESNRCREWWRMVSTWILLALLLSQLLQGWLLWQVYELYWVIYRAVQITGS